MTRVIKTSVPFVALVLAGCGNSTDVSGKVTYQGKPVVYGTVVILGSDGIPKSGAIQPDGSFRVSGVKLGSAKVAVSSPQPPGSTPPKKARERGDDDDKPPPEVTPASPEVIKNWFPIPNKYGEPTKSELTVEVKSGTPLDIDLK